MNKNEKTLIEFIEFMKSSPSRPVPPLSPELEETIRTEIHPPTGLVIGKFFTLFGVSGALTLAVCPQFGVGAFTHDLSHFFMKFGAWACAIFCGVFFFGTAALTTVTVLSKDELRVLAPLKMQLFWGASIVPALALFLLGRSFSEEAMFFSPEFVTIWAFSGLGSVYFMLSQFLRRPALSSL